MRKLNYFGQNLSRLRIGGFILASIGAGATAEAKAKEDNPARKKEITMSVKVEDVLKKESSNNENFDKDKK